MKYWEYKPRAVPLFSSVLSGIVKREQSTCKCAWVKIRPELPRKTFVWSSREGLSSMWFLREFASFVFLSIIEPDRGESSLLKVKLSKRRERTGFLTDVRWGRHALSLGPHAQTGNAVRILCSENIHVCADRKHLKMFLTSFRKILLPDGAACVQAWNLFGNLFPARALSLCRRQGRKGGERGEIWEYHNGRSGHSVMRCKRMINKLTVVNCKSLFGKYRKPYWIFRNKN